MEKTICIVPHQPGLGGPASFQSRFIRVLTDRGYRVTHEILDPVNFAILVVGGTKYIHQLHQAKKAGIRVIQRLNGMNWVHRKRNTGIRHFLRAEVNNYILKTIRQLADGIIYQSDFSRDWWSRVHGEAKAISTVVHNGVDLQEFSPEGTSSKPEDKFRILLVEGNLGGGYEQGLTTAVEMVKLLNQRLEKTTELVVVGRVSAELKASVADQGVSIDWKGVVPRENIPEIDRSAHVLFSADINAACPNSVIEAMACGLPVIGYDTGALRELVVAGTGEIAPYGSDIWQLRKPDIHALADAAQKILVAQSAYSKKARQHALANFDIQLLTNRYLDMLIADGSK
jgi:glycosyltransferase involved in cell wall biosynthesis